MNDSLSIKPLVAANVTGSVLGTARAFERAATFVKNRYSRVNAFLGALNPTRIDLSHIMPRKATEKKQSLLAFHQTLTRVDASSNVVGTDTVEFRYTSVNTAGITEDEYVAGHLLLQGGFTENNCALLRAMYRGEY
jgi:hypothetical protein